MEQSADSPLDAVAGPAGSAATEAFKSLGNETRLAILVALWEAYDPFESDDTLSFSALRERVGVSDSGQFNYHLEKLEGHFVEAADDGYRLREAGLQFVRSILAGAGIDEATLEPAPINMRCGRCGGPVEVGYEDEYLYNVCTECEGLYAESGERKGHLSKFPFEPAGLADRTPAEMYAAAWVRGYGKLHDMIEGVCNTCSGTVERSIAVCEDHDEEGVCDACGRVTAAAAQFRCTVCKDWAVSPLGSVAKYHPAVVAFHHERGVDLQCGIADLDHINRRLETGDTNWELLSDDPPRARVTIELDGDRISVELDESLSVVDVTE